MLRVCLLQALPISVSQLAICLFVAGSQNVFAQNQNASVTNVNSGHSANARLAYITMPSQANINAMRLIAAQLYQSLEFGSAANEYRQICRIPQADANDHYWLGESLYHANDYAGAAQEFYRSIQLNNKLEESYVRLVQSYLATKEMGQASQTCQSALAVVTDPYRRKRLEVLAKIASNGATLPAPSSECPTIRN